ncbi:MAG: hypothetical protein ACP5UD_07350 [Conexivisphaera sp.]
MAAVEGERARGLLMEAIGVPYPVREIAEHAHRKRDPSALAWELEARSRGAAREMPETIMGVVRAYASIVRAWFFGEGSLDEALAAFEDASTVITQRFPEISKLSEYFNRLPEDEKHEVIMRYAFRIAEAMRRNRDAFREAIRRGRADDPKEPWILIYYDALMRLYQLAGEGAFGRAPASVVIFQLSAYPSVLIGYLAGEADARTFSWIYSDLVSSIDALPTPPPRDLGLAEAVLEAVVRLVE